MSSQFQSMIRKQELGWLQRQARAILFGTLERAELGCLTIEDGETTRIFGKPGPWPEGKLRVLQPSFYLDVILGGTNGAAESFMEGNWETSNLATVVRFMSRNIQVMEQMEGGLARLGMPLLRWAHWIRKNTKRGARKNIAAHYDLGNEFFEAFLDRRMMYSSAVFPQKTATLDEGATHKLERICLKLRLKPSDHLLEIGTGWGGLAIYAAQHFGCRVTTTTISRRQYDYAAARIAEAGLQDRIDLLCCDYRDLRGQFDKLVSVEMIEAVGHHYFNDYFAACSRLLKPEGMLLIQAITIPDDRYHAARRSVDFIKRYIFPVSCIPSVGAMIRPLAKHTDLRLFHFEDQTPHYERTLALWHENFVRSVEAIRALGYPERFLRMWTFYLKYCQGGFAERVIGSAQLMYAKPFNRDEPLLVPVS